MVKAQVWLNFPAFSDSIMMQSRCHLGLACEGFKPVVPTFYNAYDHMTLLSYL